PEAGGLDMNARAHSPFNTVLADLDETLRDLVTRELDHHGFEGVAIAFDTPTAEWSAKLSVPTMNLFLYYLGESRDRKAVDWERSFTNGRPLDRRPPLKLEVSYAITAWAQAPEDEHRLLSQVLAILYDNPILPDEILVGALGDRSIQAEQIESRVL